MDFKFVSNPKINEENWLRKMGWIKLCSLQADMWPDLVRVFLFCNFNTNNTAIMESKVGSVDVSIDDRDFEKFLTYPSMP